MENTNYREPQQDENEIENTSESISDFFEPVYKQFATDDREDDDLEQEDDTEDDDTEDDDTSGDWGTVDPLEHPGPPSDMDPSAPGSAV